MIRLMTISRDMKTLEELFCETHRCASDRYRRVVFWHCLPWHAKLMAPFLGGPSGTHFTSDRALIAGAGRATDMRQLNREIKEYFFDQQNRGWLRQVAGVRVSTRRLIRMARQYLPPAGASARLSDTEAASGAY